MDLQGLVARFRAFPIINKKLMAAGLAFLLKLAFVPLYGFYKHFIRPRRNLIERYGKGWALITGASAGIGLSFCY
jgi:hypothetical protein